MSNKPIFFSNHRKRKRNLEIKNINDQPDLSNNMDNHNVLDIGFGDGDSIIKARKRQNQKIYGIESYEIGVNKVITYINKLKMKDIYVYKGDAVEIIDIFPDKFFDCVNIFFPDPWPKRRHHKRRFISKYFLSRLKAKVKKINEVHITSDHINFIFDTKHIVNEYLKKNLHFSNHRSDRPITKYEKKALSKRHIIFDIIFNL